MSNVVGRFAPSPSGRMHLGNAFSALLAWLSVRSADGTLVLRMGDLDPERTNEAFASQIREDLRWLGLDWDRRARGSGCAQRPMRRLWRRCGRGACSTPAGAPAGI